MTGRCGGRASDGGTHGVETQLNREIGVVGAIPIGVGTMIAADIFVRSGLAVSNVGAMATVSFLIAAIVVKRSLDQSRHLLT